MIVASIHRLDAGRHRRGGVRLCGLLCSLHVLIVLAAADAQPLSLEGTVRGADGRSLKCSEVLLYDYDVETIAPEGARARTTTDQSGRFHFDGLKPGRVLVEVRGEAGAGRVAVDLDEPGSGITITYPVRTEIVILHDNDQHFNFHLHEPTLERIEQYRRDHTNVFLMNAGDIFTRHRHRWEVDDVAYYVERAHYMIDVMNERQYDVMTAGNHELHPHGAHTKAALERAEFPILAANFSPHDELPEFEPYVVLESDNRHTVAVLGLTVGDATFDPDRAVREHLHLREEHDVFVALTHVGFNRDRMLAERFPQFDVIIGGHSHTLINPERAVPHHRGQFSFDGPSLVNGVLVAQAGGIQGSHRVDETFFAYLGKVVLVLENGRLVEKTNMVYVFEPAAVLQEAGR